MRGVISKRVSIVLVVLFSASLLLGLLLLGGRAAKTSLQYVNSQPHKQYTVGERLEQYGGPARKRWAAPFAAAGVTYPPRSIVLLGLKEEKRLDVIAANADGKLRFIRGYPILAASGGPGPKLREGDRQVPEGIYEIALLNPNSLYHLSLRVSYPNAFDRKMGELDQRTDLGGDIMIHGSNASIGCLAMGDEASEDLFVLAAEIGIKNIKVVLTPVDFRVRKAPKTEAPLPSWSTKLYAQIKTELAVLPMPR
jgi:hypothetical protein